MAEEIYNRSVIPGATTLHMDGSPVAQPKGTHRYALNAVNSKETGEEGFISNEPSTFPSGSIPEGFTVIGNKYIEENNTAVILTNETTSEDDIALIDRDGKYSSRVRTSVLDLNVRNQCDIVFRIRRGKERVIYWTDGDNNARTFNYDRPYNFYSQAFKDYIKAGGDPNTYVGEKWDAASFELIKTFSQIPSFTNIEIIENGSILPGNYNFAIQLVDEDLNPTIWITTSNTVNIYNDTITNPYDRIRGSKNINSDAQSFPRANKSIKLTITNLDESFPYYRVAIIQANGLTGQPNKVLISDLYPTSDSNFVYSGNDGSLMDGSLEDIVIEKEVIFSPRHIEQIENRCLLAHTKGKSINWCDFQKFASKIRTDITYKEVLLNNIISEPNVKNAKSFFMFGGFMPGEVYAINAHYIFNDGYISPGFHIPGVSDTTPDTDMKPYEIESRYLDIHNCSTDNYWAFDSNGDSLLGKKVRHHRFPFRKEVNKPLYTKSSNSSDITKYRLKVTISLNPDWESDPPGTPNSYPETGGNPAVIPYRFLFLVDGATIDTPYNGILTNSDIGVEFTIYDDLTPLDEIEPGEEMVLDDTSSLAVNYQDVDNERFLIEYEYEEYIVSSSIDNDVSEIFGLKFSNIERPHPDVIGIIFTKAERTDDDKMILDNAIIGPMTQFDQYKSFGLIMPKQFYEVNNCGGTATAGKTLSYYQDGVWFFNPEFQFFNKKAEHTSIEVEGVYTEEEINLPTISNKQNSQCNNGGSRGVYINDVQAGTSYNPDVNKKKDKDDDGFDLLIGYRNTRISYAINDTIVFPDKRRVLYLNAASYQNLINEIIYNVSVDNKIGFHLTDSDEDIDTNIFFDNGTLKNKLVYGSLVRESNFLYTNFLTRTYYKMHNNPIYFGDNETINDIEIFGGDARISSLNFVSSVFYDMVVADRAKKSGLWKIIAGAVLVVAGVVVGIFTAGAGLTISAVGAGILAGLAISYGVSLAVSGIKFEQFKKMVDVDYEKGLKDTVIDGGVFETIRDSIEREDDTIRWFSDRVSNLYIESSVPVGLRAGLTSGVSDFTDAPAEYDEAGFRSYLTEKYTVIDRDQGSGRLYKGYSGAEFYDVNPDYLRINKEKQFISLPMEYDCCADDNEIFPLRIHYSEQSFQEEKIDNYRVFLPNNYRDIEGEHGEITDLYRLGDDLFAHTKEGLWNLPKNHQERVTDQIVSFIGTGSFFEIPPRKVIDDSLGSGGTQHKWATLKTKFGVFFVNEIENKIYLHGDGINELTAKGISNFAENNLKSFLKDQLYTKFGIDFTNDNNPANKNGIGYLSAYDTRFQRVLFTKRDFLILPAYLNNMTIVDQVLPGLTGFMYNRLNGKFYFNSQELELGNPVFFENKSWTLSYSLHSKSWISFHSYIPNYYIHNQGSLFSLISSSNTIWKHNSIEKVQTYYNTHRPFIIEYVDTSTIEDKIYEDITLLTRAKKYDAIRGHYFEEKFITFNKIQLYNDLQNSGELYLVVKEDQPNLQDWYQQQTVNIAGQILVSRREGNWNINDFRDYVIDDTMPHFSSRWADILSVYPIDKISNTGSIDFQKDWTQLESFRGKYVVIRLKFDTFDDVSLTVHSSIQTTQPST